MEVEELRPRSAIPPSPLAGQCQAEGFYYRSCWQAKLFAERGWDTKKCSNGASVKIDGVGLCRQHAGQVAIDKLVEMGRAETKE